MARGGYGSGSGVALQDRVRRSGSTPVPPREDTFTTSEAAAPAERAEPVAPDTDCPARHCWVSVPVDGPAPRPGLLLEWRRADLGRWEGRVVYAAELRPGRWACVEEWVPAELLSAD